MSEAYDDRLRALYSAPLADFVAERKRLAAELKQAGDRELAARFSKLPRPPLSAWAVNQLWWHERARFERLMNAAARLGRGEQEAKGEHRELLARLRERAAQLLESGGHAATEVTLRRLGTTLAALAAEGGFSPDPAGALSADRDPPGFASAFAFVEAGAPRAERTPQAKAAEPAVHRKANAEAASAERAASRERARAAELERRERARLEKARAVELERQRLEKDLRKARDEHAAGAAELETLHAELAKKELRQKAVLEKIDELEHALRDLEAEA